MPKIDPIMLPFRGKERTRLEVARMLNLPKSTVANWHDKIIKYGLPIDLIDHPDCGGEIVRLKTKQREERKVVPYKGKMISFIEGAKINGISVQVLQKRFRLNPELAMNKNFNSEYKKHIKRNNRNDINIQDRWLYGF